MSTLVKSRRALALATVAGTLLVLPGCINGTVRGKPLAPLNYQHIAPLTVSAGQVDVINHYHPTAASDLAASAFPTRPEDAVNHYAENRLKAKGYEGTLKFVLEDATVKHSIVQPDSSVMKWAGAGIQDRYDITLHISLQHTEANGNQSGQASIDLARFITVPQGYSIAKRQATLRDFTQKMVEEIDGMVTTALQDRMHMVVSEEGGGSAPADTSHYDNDGTATMPDTANGPGMGPGSVESTTTAPLPPSPVKPPEALPPPW